MGGGTFSSFGHALRALGGEYGAAEVVDIAIRSQLIDRLTAYTGELVVTTFVALRISDALFFLVAKRDALLGAYRRRLESAAHTGASASRSPSMPALRAAAPTRTLWAFRAFGLAKAPNGIATGVRPARRLTRITVASGTSPEPPFGLALAVSNA